MIWTFDLTTIPRDGTSVILACRDGKTVTKSRWLPPGKERKIGRWEGLATKEEPIAWMLYPAHPSPAVDAQPRQP